MLPYELWLYCTADVKEQHMQHGAGSQQVLQIIAPCLCAGGNADERISLCALVNAWAGSTDRPGVMAQQPASCASVSILLSASTVVW